MHRLAHRAMFLQQRSAEAGLRVGRTAEVTLEVVARVQQHVGRRHVAQPGAGPVTLAERAE